MAEWWGDEMAGDPELDTDSHRPFLHKHLRVRIVVGITCALSVVGSLLIILSYICFKDLQSRARLILFHISIMDCGVGLANLIGAAVYYDQYYMKHRECLGNVTIVPDNILYCRPKEHIQILCVTQAGFAYYFTLGSIMWTISLSFYLYLLIVHQGTSHARYSIIFSTIFSYAMPLLLALWLALTGKLGFSPYESAGWCSTIFYHPETGKRDIFTSVVGYDLWIYLTLFLVPILSVSVHLHIREERKRAQPHVNLDRYHQALQNVDYKFLLFPVAFLVVRIWSCVVSILLVYGGIHSTDLPRPLDHALIYLSGIGDSGQGLVNVILFVIFTKKVRNKVFNCPSCWKMVRMRAVDPERQQLLNNAPRNTFAQSTGVSRSLDGQKTPPQLENSTSG